MKAIYTLALLALTTIAFAQKPEPKYAIQEDMVEVTYYHDNGTVAQTGFFLDGKLHGKWKMFDTNGKKIAMGQYEDGRKSGKWFFWENNGLKEVDYQNNQIASVLTWKNAEALVINE